MSKCVYNFWGHRFYRYVVNIGRWSPYDGGQFDRFHCICNIVCLHCCCFPYIFLIPPKLFSFTYPSQTPSQKMYWI